MDYGKNAIQQKQSRLRSRKPRIASFFKLLAFRIILLFALGLCAAAVAGGIGLYRGVVSKAPSLDGINRITRAYPSTIYYADGSTMVNSFSASGQREYVPYAQISQYAIDAFIAYEDESFRDHNGVNPRKLFSSVFSTPDKNTVEESTITQKLIQNQIFEKENLSLFAERAVKKIQEQYLAVKLESYTDKNLILEYYLNTLNFGNGYYGIEMASQVFFNKKASELTISEAAVLAPIADSPTLMNPLLHTEENRDQRNIVLAKMKELEFITGAQYDEAMADTENVYLRIRQNASAKNNRFSNNHNSYFVDSLLTQLHTDLINEGYSSYDATNLIYNGGLTIYSTQDREIQNILDEEFSNEKNFPAPGEGGYYELDDGWSLAVYFGGDKWEYYHISDLLEYYSDYEDTEKKYYHSGEAIGISTLTVDSEDLNAKIDEYIEYIRRESDGISFTETNRNLRLEPQAAMAVIDPSNGNVLALYGGRGQRTSELSLNRADAYKQPGSAFSVLSTYVPALDTAGFTLASTFDDSYYGNSLISNWYTTGFEGLSTIRRGIYHSMNIVSARCYDAVGAGTSMAYLKQFEFDALDETADRNVLSSVGMLSNGVSVLELTGAYSAIANEGIYHEPRLYTAVFDQTGNLILGGNEPTKQVMKTSTAQLLTSAMKDTVSKGTGVRCAFENLDIEIAGKTGNSPGDSDLWFIGYTPYYCAGIWSGFDGGLSQTQTQYQKELWSKCMERIHIEKGLTEGKFSLPSTIKEYSVCQKCGKLAVHGLCDVNSAGNLITSEIFAPESVPTENCTCCMRVSLCGSSGQLAGPSCPASSIHMEVVLDKTESEDSILHGGTKDTPYCLSADKNKICTIHNQEEEPALTPTGN